MKLDLKLKNPSPELRQYSSGHLGVKMARKRTFEHESAGASDILFYVTSGWDLCLVLIFNIAVEMNCLFMNSLCYLTVLFLCGWSALFDLDTQFKS